MARALIAVGAALALAFAGLGLVVYLNRDEDRVAVDNLLSERLTRDLQLSEDRGQDVDLARETDFAWDRVLFVEPGTPLSRISRALGSTFRGSPSFQGGELMVFARGTRMVRYADYRGRGVFARIRRPVGELPRDRAVLRVRDLVIFPAP
jgi:hypothetical protein